MSEANTMLSFVILQMMQNAQCYHNIRISESRVIAQRLRVAHDESSPASVRPFGRSNTSWIDVEPEIIDVWKPWQYLCRTTSNIDDLITSFCPDVAANKLATQRVSANGVLPQVVEQGDL
jgi:hypothetical protein